MSNFTAIAVELINTGTIIHVRDHFNDSAEVLAFQFEGDSYSITYGTENWSDITTIMAGEKVDCFNGQTFLRAEKDISVEEWQAKGDAIEADIDRMQGRVARNVDALLMDTVAAAVGVPALVAAE